MAPIDENGTRIHASTADSSQPTARAPSRIGWGRLPLATRTWMEALAGPALGVTAGRAGGRQIARAAGLARACMASDDEVCARGSPGTPTRHADTGAGNGFGTGVDCPRSGLA